MLTLASINGEEQKSAHTLQTTDRTSSASDEVSSGATEASHRCVRNWPQGYFHRSAKADRSSSYKASCPHPLFLPDTFANQDRFVHHRSAWGPPVPGVYDEEFSDRLLLSSRNSKHSSLCLGMQRLWIQTSSQSAEQAREEALSFRKARRSLIKRIDFRRCVSMKISFYISVIECVCVCAR